MEKKLKWFMYNQNNSGGWFDEEVGHYVLVQAHDPDEADSIAENYGIYFDGIEAGYDCECCGDRWSRAWNDGEDEPRIYGTLAEEYVDAWKDDPVVLIEYNKEPNRLKQAKG